MILSSIESIVPGFTRYTSAGDCVRDVIIGEQGTLGALARDRATGNKVAITAMHVFRGLSEFPTHDPLDQRRVGSCSGGASIGRLLRGTLTGVDAAAIELADQSDAGAGTGGVFRRSTTESDRHRPVHMIGAVSTTQNGRILQPNAAADDLRLSSVIVVEMLAEPGDSGAPLFDEEEFLLGILVGGNTTRQVFCQIGPVLDALKCQLL